MASRGERSPPVRLPARQPRLPLPLARAPVTRGLPVEPERRTLGCAVGPIRLDREREPVRSVPACARCAFRQRPRFRGEPVSRIVRRVVADARSRQFIASLRAGRPGLRLRRPARRARPSSVPGMTLDRGAADLSSASVDCARRAGADVVADSAGSRLLSRPRSPCCRPQRCSGRPSSTSAIRTIPPAASPTARPRSVHRRASPRPLTCSSTRPTITTSGGSSDYASFLDRTAR